MMMNYYSLERSMEIARERGEVFKDFDKCMREEFTLVYKEKYIYIFQDTLTFQQ